MIKDIITKQKCLRCGYEWFPRNEVLPKHCANCNSPYWNKPIERLSVSKARKKGQDLYNRCF